MDRLEKALEMANEFKLNELIGKKKEEEKKKKNRTVLLILGIIGAVAALVAVGIFLYRYFCPDCLEDFDDEFEDEFEDDEDFFEDEGDN